MSWLRRLPAALGIAVRGGAGSLRENSGLAVLSLGLAFGLWFFVTDRENPNETVNFNRAIELEVVNVPNGLAVSNISETSVRIRIEAPRSDIDRLEAEDFRATVDLGGYEEGNHVDVVVDVDAPNSRVNIVNVTPSRVNVTLEQLRTKDVPVRVSTVGSPQTGFEAATTTVEPDRVTVSGPESLVDLVDSAVAEVNLTAERTDVDQSVVLQPRDRLNGGISRVSVNPESARVRVDIVQREYSLQYAVTPLITGQPASGYNVTGVLVETAVVVLTGPLEVLQAIDPLRGVPTEEISLADARDDVTRDARLVLPDGVRAQSNDTVRVTVAVGASRGEVAFLVTPQVRNGGAGLTGTAGGAVTVTISGEVPLLQTLSPQSIDVSVDATGLGAGFHVLPVLVTPPAGASVTRIEPAEAGIALAPSP
jgi:YbbR domain-containing protein